MTDQASILGVAQAIAASCGEAFSAKHVRAARAAVIAMREPSAAMLLAAVPDLTDWGCLRSDWRAMVDYIAREPLDWTSGFPG